MALSQVVTPLAADAALDREEPLLIRPAETELRFHDFAELVMDNISGSPASPRSAGAGVGDAERNVEVASDPANDLFAWLAKVNAQSIDASASASASGGAGAGAGAGAGGDRSGNSGGESGHPGPVRGPGQESQRRHVATTGPSAGDLSFYLQKHDLNKWRDLGLLKDLSPPLHSSGAQEGQPWSRFLVPAHYLLWAGRGWTRGPVHFDENENLHTVVKGTKIFELFHPLDGEALYEASSEYRSGHLLYAFDHERGHRLWRLPLTVAPPSYQPFSPVNISHPDLRRHPRFPAARRLTCRVEAGETMFLPSYWWHEVTSLGTDPRQVAGASDDGLAIGINNFFAPFFIKAHTLKHWSRNPIYEHLRMDTDSATLGRDARKPPVDNDNYWNEARSLALSMQAHRGLSLWHQINQGGPGYREAGGAEVQTGPQAPVNHPARASNLIWV